jgi:seryl-tRNA synthetase
VDLLKRYKEEINKDLAVDDFNIKDIQQKLPSRKHFWVARLIDARIELSQLQKRKKKLKVLLSQKIASDSMVSLSQSVISNAVENSDEMEKLNDSIKEYEYIIEYLEKVEKIMSTMHWEIKNIVEIQKLEQL